MTLLAHLTPKCHITTFEEENAEHEQQQNEAMLMAELQVLKEELGELLTLPKEITCR